MVCVDIVKFSCCNFVSCCESFKVQFAAVMLSWAELPYNNVALIQY